MATEESYLTREGEDALRRELRQLVETRKPALAKKLKEAVAQGDLKRNADYHDAKEQLGFVEGRVQHMESVLMTATIVDSAGSSDEVRVGSTVVIQEIGTGRDEEYRIVGSARGKPARAQNLAEESDWLGAAGQTNWQESLGDYTGRRNQIQNCRNSIGSDDSPDAHTRRTPEKVVCADSTKPLRATNRA